MGNTAPLNPISRIIFYSLYNSYLSLMIYTPLKSEVDISLEDFIRIQVYDRSSHGASGKLNALGFRLTSHE